MGLLNGNSKEAASYFEVLESIANDQWALTTGEILEVAGRVAEVEDLEQRGLLRRLPDPGRRGSCRGYFDN